MTRQHFQFIAEVVASLADLGYCGEQKGIHPDELRVVACRFANELKRTNHAFDRERFLKACEQEVEVNSHVIRYNRPCAKPDKYDGVPADTHSH